MEDFSAACLAAEVTALAWERLFPQPLDQPQLFRPGGCDTHAFDAAIGGVEDLEFKAFVFDDTIEHEAWNDSAEPRAVLIFDIWNPLTTPAERELVSALTTGVEQFYGALPSYL